MPWMRNSRSDSSTTALSRVLAEIETPDAVRGAELGGGSVEGVLAQVEHEHAVRDGQDGLDVLLDDQECDALAVERHQRRVDRVDEPRGQRGRRLVEQQETRAHD